MKKKSKICVIGSGRWGNNHINTLDNLCNLYGVVDINEDRLNDISKKYNNIELYNSIEKAMNNNFDGFVVATNAETHYNIAKKLLEGGKNVLVEKPMSLSEKEAFELVELSKKNNCILLVGHQLLHHPAIIKIKEIINEGKIGRVLYISSTRQNLGTVRNKEDVIWSFAPHDISLINYLVGDTPISIKSSATSFLQKGIVDKANIEFTYKDNIKGYINVSWLHPTKEQKLIVVGENGMIIFDDSSEDKEIILNKKFVDTSGDIPLVKNNGIESVEYEYSKPLENELKYFINLIEGLIETENGQVGYEVVRLLEIITKQIIVL